MPLIKASRRKRTQGHLQFTSRPLSFPKQEDAEPDGTVIKKFLNQLVDTWWKMTLWIVAICVLLSIYLYITRCCYLLWDCCTDSYWGCCPRKQGCKRFMLLKCCSKSYDSSSNVGGRYEYQVCRNDVESDSMVTRSVTSCEPPTSKHLKVESSGSSEVDYTLKHVEDVIGLSENVNTRWQDTSLSILSTNKSNKEAKKPIITSTPRKGSKCRNSELPFTEEQLSNAEALPHLHEGHYFNVLNVFGMGGNKCQYSIANSTADSSFVRQPKDSTGRLGMNLSFLLCCLFTYFYDID